MPEATKHSASDRQGFGMLVFESLSVGGIAVFVALVAVLVLVGIYSYFVWPFTYWDLSSLKLENGAWWEYALGTVFAAGSAVGFWCFSGAAFRSKASQPGSSMASRSK
jgi:ABC-type Fe3+ transport system permease subunit